MNMKGIPDVLRGFHERLLDLELLEEGWSLNCPAIRPSAVTDVAHFLRIFYRMTVDSKVEFPANCIWIFPTCTAGVQVELGFGPCEIEIEFRGDQQLHLTSYQVFGPRVSENTINQETHPPLPFAAVLTRVFSEYLTYLETRKD